LHPSDPERGYVELFISTKKTLVVRNVTVGPKTRGYLLDYQAWMLKQGLKSDSSTTSLICNQTIKHG